MFYVFLVVNDDFPFQRRETIINFFGLYPQYPRGKRVSRLICIRSGGK